MLDDKSNDNTVVRITPKGFLYIELKNKGFSVKEIMEIWDAFQAFVARQARDDGYKKGLPAIVFEDNGGTCIRIERD